MRHFSGLRPILALAGQPVHPRPLRSFHPRGPVRRNVLAKFAPLPVPDSPNRPHDASVAALSLDGKAETSFETAATTPVGSSLQATPPPNSAARTKVAIELHIIKSHEDEQTVKATPVPPSQREMSVEGVLIPAKPVPPGEEGCVHCVYTIYADDLETYTSALSEARQALLKAQTPLSAWPEVIQALEKEGKSAGDIKKEAKEEVAAGMDPTMAAFFALENKLKKRQNVESGDSG